MGRHRPHHRRADGRAAGRRPARRSAQTIATRWQRWRAEKASRRDLVDAHGRLHPALVFDVLSELMPDDAAIAVDVGNNTYSFGHFFECRGRQDVLMSGYLGSIGFALPAALGASVAVRRSGSGRKVVSISGDGGLGQYLAEVTTAVKEGFPLTHIVLDNGELAKISREQLGAIRPVWQTSLVNPDFAEFATSCGAAGFSVAHARRAPPRARGCPGHHRPPQPRQHRHLQPGRLTMPAAGQRC